MTRRRALPWLLLPALGACTSFEAIDLRPYLDDQQFPISQSPVPDGAETVGLTVIEDTGFYMFGVAPVVPIKLENCVERLIEEARKVGGEGVANVEVSYQPASFLNFNALLLPDWFATLRMSGAAWRRKR